MKLGTRSIADLACPPGKQDRLVFDDELTGFGVRVTAAGEKIFVVQYRHAGQVRRLPLGRFGALTVDQARRLALKTLGEVAAGRDPWTERNDAAKAAREADRARRRQAEADAFTLSALVESWQDLGLQSASVTHRREGPRAMKAGLARLLERPTAAIDAAAAQREIDRLASGSPVMARRTRDYARAAFNWAMKRRLVAANPFAGVVVEAREQPRDRRLSDDELAAAWHAATALEYPFSPCLKLLILTLQRRSEVAGMRWSELAPDLATWLLPKERAKNGKAHIVHLAEPARQQLQALRERAEGDLVFTTDGVRPIVGFSRAKERLARAVAKQRAHDRHANGLAVEDGGLLDLGWRFHDLRRTGVSVMAQLGFAPHVADRILNHVQGSIRGVAAVYQRHEFLAERAAALEAWAAYVLRVAEGKRTPSNVVPIRRDRRRDAERK